jgi:flagellar basal body-associated protein FliL
VAEETDDFSAEAAPDTHETEEAVPKVSFLLPAINSLVLLAALGFLAYTRIIYKHPVITDAEEKKRILATQEKPTESATEIGFVAFGPITVNILASPDGTYPTSPSSPPNKGRSHYLSTAFTLEIQDKFQSPLIQTLKPFILDKLIQIVSKKHFHELATVQGRYNLHTQLIETANQTISSRTQLANKRPVSNLYFTSFLVQ